MPERVIAAVTLMRGLPVSLVALGNRSWEIRKICWGAAEARNLSVWAAGQSHSLRSSPDQDATRTG